MKEASPVNTMTCYWKDEQFVIAQTPMLHSNL